MNVQSALSKAKTFGEDVQTLNALELTARHAPSNFLFKIRLILAPRGRKNCPTCNQAPLEEAYGDLSDLRDVFPDINTIEKKTKGKEAKGRILKHLNVAVAERRATRKSLSLKTMKMDEILGYTRRDL